MISNRIRPGDAIADVVGDEARQKRNLELLLNELADQVEALQTAVADHEARITELENP